MKKRIRIGCDRYSLVMLAAMWLQGHTAQTVSLLVAAALHECGHLLAARVFGIPLASLHISVLGARLELCDPLLSYRREWLLCAAGPLFSFLCAGIAAGLSAYVISSEILCMFAMISMALGVINLLPIGWLDGGRMFRAMCLQFLPQRVAGGLLRLVSFAFFLVLWMASLYLLLRVGNSLTLFVFSFSLFLRFFLSERG